MTRQFTLVKAEAFAALKRRTVHDVPALLAAFDPYAVGDVVATMVEGFTYEVVSSGEHLVTAGGIKLKVLPLPDGALPVAAFGTLSGTDNSGLCEAVASALPPAGGSIVFPDGDFPIGAPVAFDVPEDTTVIAHGTRFVCSHDGIAFDLNPLWDPVADAGGNTHTKRRVYWYGGKFVNVTATRTASEAIRAQGMRMFVLRDAHIEGFWAGIRFGAKDSYHFENCYSYDCTFHYYNPPTATVAADKLQNVSWKDCHLSAGSSENAILIADPVANIQFRGGSINAGGTGPQVLFRDSNLVLSEGIAFYGLHIEQTDSHGGIVFQHTATGNGFYGVSVGGGTVIASAEIGWRGLVLDYVRGARVETTTFRDGSGGATEQGITINSDCRDIVIDTASTQFMTIPAANKIVLSAPSVRQHVSLLPTFVPVVSGTSLSGYNFTAQSSGSGSIDMSSAFADFGKFVLPPKGYSLTLVAADSGSAAAGINAARFRVVDPRATFFSALQITLEGVPNDARRAIAGNCMADENGDLGWQVNATGSGTLDAFVAVTGVFQ